jgi:hypothetical protein
LTTWAALFTASTIKNGENQRYRSFSGSAGQVTVPGLQFIRATQQAAFFYDADDKRTSVLKNSFVPDSGSRFDTKNAHSGAL